MPNKFSYLTHQYDSLEQEVINALYHEIHKSEYISKHVACKAIKVNVFDYTELTIINQKLVFIDSNGHHYGLFSECTILDLIDVLNSI